MVFPTGMPSDETGLCLVKGGVGVLYWLDSARVAHSIVLPVVEDSLSLAHRPTSLKIRGYFLCELTTFWIFSPVCQINVFPLTGFLVIMQRMLK